MIEHKRILIFTGDGKGKTTAALGMAFRASGHGMHSCIIQFIKSDASVGEIAAAEASSSIRILPTGLGFVPPRDDPRFEQHRAAAQAGLHKAAEIITARHFALVVLDEIFVALSCGLVDQRQVAELIEKTSPKTCLVLTGRNAPQALIAMADTVTEMRSVKHGLQAGHVAQKGIER
jgi:cob(I)alamin adenosyltransferase